MIARIMKENVAYAWPDVDIAETDDHYSFSFEIPGALKDDIKIWLENDVLTVSGEKKRSSDDARRMLFSGRAFGKFERSFRVPKSVDRNNVKAEFVDGILVVTLPKVPEAKGKEISIN
jgi:HSP20 family protein